MKLRKSTELVPLGNTRSSFLNPFTDVLEEICLALANTYPPIRFWRSPGINAVHFHPSRAIAACVTFPDTVFAGSSHFPPSAQLLSISRALKELTAPRSLEHGEKRDLTVFTSPQNQGLQGTGGTNNSPRFLGAGWPARTCCCPPPGGWR